MSDHDGKPVPGDRGLYDFAEITDTHGSVIIVRNSPEADEPCAWVFGPREAHMNVEQAKRLRDALQRFIDRAEAT